jgi:murein DD-endopeptidase MepM/ murein hydrolase activator NlpD
MRAFVRLVIVIAWVAGITGTTGTASAPAATPAPVAVHYRAPVAGRVVDPFRPPSNPYAAGNRGIDYAVDAGTAVHAAAGGMVVFAGQVGGSVAVTVLHADRLSTTYTGMADLVVKAGDAVAAGQALGTTSSAFHFGVRAGDAYLDPAVLLDDRPTGPVRLVPVTVR